MNFLVLLVICFLTVIQSSQAGVSDAQRRIIDNQLFLLKEGMVSEKEVFKKLPTNPPLPLICNERLSR